MNYLEENFNAWLSLNEGDKYYHETLNPLFWEISSDDKYKFDPVIRKKLLSIADDFFDGYSDISEKSEIKDIQLTGSMANFNYTDQSDLDVHILIDFKNIEGSPVVAKAAVDGIRFAWNLRHNIKMRGHDVELYVQDHTEPHVSSGLYSILNNKWIKKPIYKDPEVDDSDVEKKYYSIASDIDRLNSKLITSENIPSNAKDLYSLSERLKKKIQRMRKEALSRGGEFSIGNLAFKKLRNSGYIGKLIDIISISYDRIYNE